MICRCCACLNRKVAAPDYEVRWPLASLERFVGSDRMALWFDGTTSAFGDLLDDTTLYVWKYDGLSDTEADRIAIAIGAMPDEIWQGYTEAGLDFKGLA